MTNDVRRHHFNNQKIYLLRIFPLIQPLFPLGNDYFHQNNIDLHVEIIHCIQAIWRHWSREPITTLSRPSVFMLEFSGQLTTPDRFSYHTGFSAIKEPQGMLRSDGRRPDGTTLIPWRAGRNLVWDATVIETIAPSYLQATAATAGAAAEIADVRKTKTYQDLLKTHHFIPLAMETLGPINETGITFVEDIGRLLT